VHVLVALSAKHSSKSKEKHIVQVISVPERGKGSRGKRTKTMLASNTFFTAIKFYEGEKWELAVPFTEDSSFRNRLTASSFSTFLLCAPFSNL